MLKPEVKVAEATLAKNTDEMAEAVKPAAKTAADVADEIPKVCDPACFVAGTMVLTDNGLKAIEEIQAGDTVIATDPETGETAEKEVVETYINETDELVHVWVDGEEIVTTPTHPFYAPEKGWTSAIELRAGDKLQLVNGEYVVIEAVQHEILEEPVKVYNFQVEDFHTYYVGTDVSVLVHNTCPVDESAVSLPNFDGKTRGILITEDGTIIELESGYGNSNYSNYPAYNHVEGQSAIIMRENNINNAVIYHNNPNGTCPLCNSNVPTLLPTDATLTVIPPKNASAPNNHWIDVPKTYVGNKNNPKSNQKR